MYRIGLTGGVGSGKSTVSSYMKEFGIPVIDGDCLAMEAVAPGNIAMREIRQVFGNGIFNEDGSLNRLKTAEIIFKDEEKRKALNGIIHPYIWRRTQEEVIAAQNHGYFVVVLDMVMARNGFTRKQVLERIHKQMPTENELNYADVVIDNSRSPEDTKRQVREALMQIPGFVFPGGCND